MPGAQKNASIFSRILYLPQVICQGFAGIRARGRVRNASAKVSSTTSRDRGLDGHPATSTEPSSLTSRTCDTPPAVCRIQHTLRIPPPSYDTTSALTGTTISDLPQSKQDAFVCIVDKEMVHMQRLTDHIARDKLSSSLFSSSSSQQPFNRFEALSAIRESCNFAVKAVLRCRTKSRWTAWDPNSNVISPTLRELGFELENRIATAADAARGTRLQASRVARNAASATGNVIGKVVSALDYSLEGHYIINILCTACHYGAASVSTALINGPWPLPPEGLRIERYARRGSAEAQSIEYESRLENNDRNRELVREQPVPEEDERDESAATMVDWRVGFHLPFPDTSPLIS